MVPFAKARLAVDDAQLGLLLLSLGIGSVLAMLATGPVSARWGPRPVIIATALLMAVLLPCLAITPTFVLTAGALFAFGAGLGSLDVAMNIHAVEVEKRAGRNLMSGFHGLFSVGGVFGAGLVTVALTLGASPLVAALAPAVLIGVLTMLASTKLLDLSSSSGAPLFAVPRGIVLLLAMLAAITFLAEGAITDWSALLITSDRLVNLSQGGSGYLTFAIAMTIGRFTGDAIVDRFGDFRVMLVGGAVAVAGFVALLVAPAFAVAGVGFGLIGLGAANLVPILFRHAGTQQAMPPGLAIAAITTTGYAGVLLGPAAIGLIADLASLRTAFWLIGGLMLLVPLCAALVTGAATRR